MYKHFLSSTEKPITNKYFIEWVTRQKSQITQIKPRSVAMFAHFVLIWSFLVFKCDFPLAVWHYFRLRLSAFGICVLRNRCSLFSVIYFICGNFFPTAAAIGFVLWWWGLKGDDGDGGSGHWKKNWIFLPPFISVAVTIQRR